MFSQERESEKERESIRRRAKEELSRDVETDRHAVSRDLSENPPHMRCATPRGEGD